MPLTRAKTDKKRKTLKLDSVVNYDNIIRVMQDENEKSLSMVDIGQKLVSHSKEAEFTANRGLVYELFPFIYEASDRMSARAIGRFLEEEQNIKLSAVTITKALNDPKKSWLSFFATIEPEAVTLAKHTKSKTFNYLFLSRADYESRTSPDREGKITGIMARGIMALKNPELLPARKAIIAKWFSIGLGTRLKAKPYLEQHLMELVDKF